MMTPDGAGDRVLVRVVEDAVGIQRADNAIPFLCFDLRQNAADRAAAFLAAAFLAAAFLAAAFLAAAGVIMRAPLSLLRDPDRVAEQVAQAANDGTS